MLYRMVQKRMKGKTVLLVTAPVIALAFFMGIIALTSCTSAAVNPAAAVQSAVQPEFQVVGLGVNPAVVKPGEEVQVVASIVNSSNGSGEYTADLKIDGITSGTTKVNVPPGGTQEVAFRLSREAVHIYQVNMGELSGQFEVKGQQADVSVPGSSASPGGANCCAPSGTGTSASSGSASCCGGSAASPSTVRPGASVTVQQKSSCCQ